MGRSYRPVPMLRELALTIGIALQLGLPYTRAEYIFRRCTFRFQLAARSSVRLLVTVTQLVSLWLPPLAMQWR